MLLRQGKWQLAAQAIRTIGRVQLISWTGVVLCCFQLNHAVGREPLPPTVSASSPIALAEGQAKVYFTPWDDAEGAIMRAVRNARSEVLVQAYSFTSGAIAGELINARKRGVDVRVTADQNETERIPTSRISHLARSGIPVWLESRYQAAHNKVMVIDADAALPVVVTGSYNWTVAAQRRNAENVLIVSGNAGLARAYKTNWERHRLDALPYVLK
jgi:phosphatidylserine/phosphatidylglycerophosphate/cardiolipin synthase-like enzyme